MHKMIRLIIGVITIAIVFILGYNKSKTTEEKTKTIEEYSQEYDVRHLQVVKLLTEEKNIEAIEKAKINLEIAKNKLKDNDKILESLHQLSGIYHFKLNDYVSLNKYSTECRENKDFSETKDNDLKYTICILYTMKAKIYLAENEYKEDNLEQALIHLDRVKRDQSILTSY